MRDTSYAKELKSAVLEFSGGSEARIERLHIEELQQEEIRLSWWKDGKLMLRPLDLSEAELIDLMASGIREGVLSSTFADDLRRAAL